MHDSQSQPVYAADQTDFNLAAFYRQKYRAAFHAALAAGHVKPLTIPWSFVGPVILPLVYLSIPHTQRPWLYRMRWAVAAAVVYLNARLMQTTSSGNEAVAYATGLIASWGTIWSLTLLIFTRPQWEAARVQRRPRESKSKANGHATANDKSALPKPPDESVAVSWPHYEYVWQRFPTNEAFLTRLGWTFDLFTSFRGAGWNHSVPTIPHPPFPSASAQTPKPGGTGGEQVPAPAPARIDLTPPMSRAGVVRSQTYAAFARSRLASFALAYLVIDLWTLAARRDPYFLLGPDYPRHGVPLPPPLAALPLRSVTLPLLRSLAAVAGVLSALHLYHSLLQLLLCCVLPVLGLHRALGAHAELWQHPTLMGSFTPSVLDRGLPGLWGGWWHQTFRRGFVSPGRWLLGCVAGGGGGGGGGSESRMRGGRKVPPAVAMVVDVVGAFLLSGLVHASGGATAVPAGTVAWTPVAFFMLQAVGVLGQTAFCYVLKGPIDRLAPRWARRTGNLLFAALWLHLTAWGLIDDMSRAGLWLFEPVPVSPLRMMGLRGLPGEGWWRWDGEYGMRWYSGKRWWESGIWL
ncbi:hypothetical protein MMYC01_207641 [Madurella mycetomatis]|uniref:Wax synthase domain-containing protein n=1 Tax=Madurella mycetomatis TaxID=100816 RepID=A0A175VUB3_9PEZI|nr:hypothetical protein MMYC01_207641 [Madurella mycetomatis]